MRKLSSRRKWRPATTRPTRRRVPAISSRSSVAGSASSDLLSIDKDAALTRSALALLSAQAVRERANELLEIGLSDALPSFRVDMQRLPHAARFAAHVIRENYPSLNV